MMERIWHPWDQWEEVAHNMWGEVLDRRTALETAIGFTADARLYGSYMQRVIREWPISCENALTDQRLNRRAWIGHAAAALAHGLPEDITREAWGYLNNEQRILANREADRAIAAWENAGGKNRDIPEYMGTEVLPWWDPR